VDLGFSVAGVIMGARFRVFGQVHLALGSKPRSIFLAKVCFGN